MWFVKSLANLPLYLTLIAGVIICSRQCERRPNMARLLGAAIVLTFLLDFGGSIYFSLLIAATVAQQTNSMMAIVFSNMAFSLLEAVAWALAFWSVLGVEDRPVDDLDANGD